MTTESNEQLSQKVQQQARRMQKAEQEKRSLLAESLQVGSLGLVLVVPVIAGAYLGNWLDGMSENYSSRWTISLIVLGLALGAFNVFRSVGHR